MPQPITQDASTAGVAPAALFVDHVALVVRDATASADRWEQALGLRVDHDEVLDQIGVRLVHLVGTDPGAATAVQLVEPRDPSAAAARYLADHGEGLHHVCFAVADVGGTLRTIRGEEVTGTFQGAKDRRACFLGQRLCGALVELVEVGAGTPGEERRR